MFTWFVLSILVVVVFIVVMSKKKKIVKKGGSSFKNIDDQYNEAKINKQKELDFLLDKINKKGIDQLSEKEIKRLKELS